MRSPFDAAAQLAAARAPAPPNPSRFPAIFSRTGQRELSDPKTLEQLKAYRNTIYKVVRFRYNQVAKLNRSVVSVKLQREPGGQDKEVRTALRDHPVTKMLGKGASGRPNPWTTSGNFLAGFGIDLDLTGNSYSLKVRDPRTLEPAWLIRLRPDWVKVVPDERVGIQAYAYRRDGLDGGRQLFAPSEIVHLKYPSPLDDRVGWSPLRSMAYATELGQEIRRFQWQFFEQGARMDGVIQGAQTTDQASEVYDMMVENYHKGAETAWLPLVLPGGYTWQPTQQTAKDFEFAALAQFSQEDVAEGYGVPLALLGTVKDVSLANLLGLMTISAENGTKPQLRTIEEHLELCLLSDFPPPSGVERLEFDFEDPTPGDPEQERKQEDMDLRQGVRVVNEIRELREGGLPPVAWGAVPLVGASMAPLDTLGEEPPPGAGEGEGEGEEE